MTTSLSRQLAQWLAGEFGNAAQAMEQPTWFVQLRWWHRPIPQRLEGHLALFAEQANSLYLQNPYRQRILLIQENADATPENSLRVRYLAFRHPEQFRGAGLNPQLLSNLSIADLEQLPGCELTAEKKGDRFIATPEPDAKCFFQYEGKTRQVVLGFEVGDRHFLSYDRGVDPDTGQSLWGALMGPYSFEKLQDYSSELPST